MPNLISFAIYDGIPPKEEGQDPTIFWYYPHSVSKDSQLNEIGLYMTFTGFCRDFRSSQDCEYFETDKSLTVFINMGADVFAAARFETSNPSYHRACLQSIKMFNRIYTMLFSPPSRLPDDSLDAETSRIFNTYLDEMINLFKSPPFIGKTVASLELWTFCEEIFSDIKTENSLFRSGAILYNGKIIHSSMNSNDLLSLFLCYRTELPTLFPCEKLDGQNSEFKWILKNFKKPVKLSSITGIPVIFSYQKLLVILIFSSFCDFAPIQKAIEPLLQKDISTFKATADLEEKQSPSSYHEENGNTILIWPSKQDSVFGDQSQNELLVNFMNANNNQFVRLCGTSEQKNSWIILEKANNRSTFIDIQGKTMGEAMSNYSNFRKTSPFT